MRIAVFGGSGFIGREVCKLLVTCGCAVTSISRSGEPKKLPDEPWASQVRWMKADCAIAGEAAGNSVLLDGCDGAVSCMGAGDLLRADADGWKGRFYWSDKSNREFAENFEANAEAAKLAKAAGAQRFVYVGCSTDSEQGFAGPQPGLYSGKRAAALAARDVFGVDAFTYVGPHLVVNEGDVRLKAMNSGLIGGLNGVNDFIGSIRSFGPDYTTKTKLTPPVPVADVASVIAAAVTGKVEVEEGVRCAGITVEDGQKDNEAKEIEDPMRHVDGTAAIIALAEKARSALAV